MAALLAAGFRVAASTREAAFLAVAVLVDLADLGFAADLDEALTDAEGRAVAVRVEDFLSDLLMVLGIARFSGCQEWLKMKTEVPTKVAIKVATLEAVKTPAK